jgi:hypothetical protein
MNVHADDVRRLLADEHADAAMVLIEGRVEVKSPAELDSPDYRGAFQIATRQEILRRTGRTALSDNELKEQAEALDTAVRNLGG